MSSRWARTARCTGAVCVAVVLSVLASVPVAAKSAREITGHQQQPSLTLVAQSPWVEPATPWFHLSLKVADSAEPVRDLRVTVTIFSRIEDASQLQQSMGAVPDKSELKRVDVPIVPGGGGGGATMCITVLPDGESTPPTPPAGAAGAFACPVTAPTVYLDCTPGNGTCGQIYPVSVSLSRVGGSGTVDRFTTFLTYQEPNVEGTGPLRVATIMPVSAARGGNVGAAGVSAVEGTTGQLSAHRGVALTLAVDPSTAAALHGAGSKGRSALEQLADLTAPGLDQLLPQPFTPIDLAALARAGLKGEVTAQMDRGAQLLHQAGLHAGGGTWVDTMTPFTSADNGALATGLSTAKSTHVVVDDSVLSQGGSEEYTLAQPFTLDLGHGDHVTAAAANSQADSRFTADPGDPALAANQLLADLMFFHFENVFLPDLRGVVIQPPLSWRPTAAFDDALLGGLTANPGLQPVTLSQLFAQVPTGGNGEPAQRHLQSGAPARADVLPRALALRISTDRIHLDSFLSAVHGRPAALTDVADALLATEAAPLNAVERAAALSGYQARFQSLLDTISLAPERTITFTSRTAPIPVTVLHTASYSVTVVLTLDSDKFTFPGGNTRRLVLDRPTTPVRIQAKARSSGDGLPVEVTLRTPDGQLVIAHTTVAVHSTSISIVGIALTALAGLTLLVWWGRTWRKSRRHRPRAH